MSSAPDGPAAAAATEGFDAWMASFLRSYYAHRPVNATFIGVHEHDGRLPDLTEAGADAACAEMRELLAASEPLRDAALDPVARRDLRLARGFLEIQLWEFASDHFQRGNPSTWTGEAVFGIMSLFLTDYAPMAERAEAAQQRLAAIPGFLEDARRTLCAAPAEWTERALRECLGAARLLTDGIDSLIRDAGAPATLRQSATPAARAFARFADWLRSDLAARPAEVRGCGPEPLSLYLRRGHFIDQVPDEIVRRAEGELAAADAALREQAAELGARSPQEALAPLAAIHPDTNGYYRRYHEFWDRTREICDEQTLLTWPDSPIRYVPRPRWTRAAAPYLYFLFYRSPASFGRPAVHDYLVTPIDADMPQREQERLLRENNDETIKLNHVIHHGSIGHHVQNWHAGRTTSHIGSIAAVDCAARIAMFCGGTMAEGWACYATDLMAEAGMLTPLERLAELNSRRRMCARTIVDIRLHQRRWSFDDAVAFYTQAADMPAAAARAEVVKNSMFPGAAIIYLLGTDAIHELRRDLATRQGNAFDLCAFHDEFLSYGSIPVALIAQDMLGRLDDAG